MASTKNERMASPSGLADALATHQVFASAGCCATGAVGWRLRHSGTTCWPPRPSATTDPPKLKTATLRYMAGVGVLGWVVCFVDDLLWADRLIGK